MSNILEYISGNWPAPIDLHVLAENFSYCSYGQLWSILKGFHVSKFARFYSRLA